MNDRIILLHGALGSCTQLHYLEKLLSSSYEVNAFNFEGHGGRPLNGPFSIDHFVKTTIDFMDAQNITSVNFFGYSMGGYVALKLAHDHPKRASKIVTLGTKFDWTPESAAKEVRMMNPDIIEQKLPVFASTLKERHLPEDWKEIMHRTAEMMTKLGDGEAMTDIHFGEIENEVLIGIGTSDHMVSIEESERTANQLMNGKLQKIEGFNHPLEAIDQNVLAEICKTFFSS